MVGFGKFYWPLSKGKEGKAYILLYACTIMRGFYLDLLSSLETSECLDSLEQFIASRGRPERIFSDNGRTFVGIAKWIKALMRRDKLQYYLARQKIKSSKWFATWENRDMFVEVDCPG